MNRRRRRLLQAAATGIGGLAGCAGLFQTEGGQTDQPTTDDTTTMTTTDPTTDTGTSGAIDWILSDAGEDGRPTADPGAHDVALVETGQGLQRFLSTGDGWVDPGVYSQSVQTRSLSHGRTVAVTSVAELEAAFADLQRGDRVYVYQPETPYRTQTWLDVDTSDVTVVAESTFAANGEPIVKPADGANVGGIRIGTTGTAQRVRVSGYGHHGNTKQMADDALRLHAITVGAGARNVVVSGGYLTRTHPYNRHDVGGSGVSIRPGADAVQVERLRITDIGDRGIQLGGNRITVARNTIDDGYDRGVSMDVFPPDDNWYYTTNTRIVNNDIRTASNGSLVGVMGRYARADKNVPADEALRNVLVAGNRVTKGLRNGVKFAGLDPQTDERIAVVHNVIEDHGKNGVRFMSNGNGSPIGAVIANNTIRGVDLNGVRAETPGTVVANNSIVAAGTSGISVPHQHFDPADGHDHGVTVTGNDVRGVSEQGIAVAAPHSTITGNRVDEAGGDGIDAAGTESTVVGNQVRQSGGIGILVDADRVLVAGNLAADSSAEAAEIGVRGSAVAVGSNLVRGAGAGVVDTRGAADNHYVGNRVETDTPWDLTDADATAMANRPNPAGYGYLVTGADGTTYEIGVDADGNVTADET